MSVYKPSEDYIARKLAKVAAENLECGRDEYQSADALRRKRLELDLAAILTGPTCGSEADRLAFLAVSIDPTSLANAMKEASDRYLASLLPKKL